MISLTVASCGLGLLGALATVLWGPRLRLIDVPNRRSSHSRPTPKGGGIGILAAILILSLSAGLPLLYCLAAGVISLLGLYGDYRELSPRFRLLLQFCCAILALLALHGHPENIGYYLLLPFWLIFVVGTANFYNFMDGINGIAGLTGVVAFSLFVLYLPEGADPSYTSVALAAAGACAGFLPLNLPRARVFMGDVGSILLGFVFATLVSAVAVSFFDLLCYASLLFPFYIDELSTMAIRLRDGERLFVAHRRHLYQLLANEKGLAHWQVTLGYGLLQAVVAGVVFGLRPLGISAVLAFLLLSSLAVIVFSLHIRRRLCSGQ